MCSLYSGVETSGVEAPWACLPNESFQQLVWLYCVTWKKGHRLWSCACPPALFSPEALNVAEPLWERLECNQDICVLTALLEECTFLDLETQEGALFISQALLVPQRQSQKWGEPGPVSPLEGLWPNFQRIQSFCWKEGFLERDLWCLWWDSCRTLIVTWASVHILILPLLLYDTVKCIKQSFWPQSFEINGERRFLVASFGFHKQDCTSDTSATYTLTWLFYPMPAALAMCSC